MKSIYIYSHIVVTAVCAIVRGHTKKAELICCLTCVIMCCSWSKCHKPELWWWWLRCISDWYRYNQQYVLIRSQSCQWRFWYDPYWWQLDIQHWLWFRNRLPNRVSCSLFLVLINIFSNTWIRFQLKNSTDLIQCTSRNFVINNGCVQCYSTMFVVFKSIVTCVIVVYK